MDSELTGIAQEALAQTGSASAVIFFVDAAGNLELAGVAGLDGAPLGNLIEAVKAPNHPIARSSRDGHTEFDVAPINPGGPALRSHVPLVAADRSGRTVGVLALAHQAPLTSDQRRSAQALADRAARATKA